MAARFTCTAPRVVAAAAADREARRSTGSRVSVPAKAPRGVSRSALAVSTPPMLWPFRRAEPVRYPSVNLFVAVPDALQSFSRRVKDEGLVLSLTLILSLFGGYTIFHILMTIATSIYEH